MRDQIQLKTFKFLRLALDGDLATAWPFAVEGEAFAHRFLFKSSLKPFSPNFPSKLFLSELFLSELFLCITFLVFRFRAWVAPVLDSLLQHIR